MAAQEVPAFAHPVEKAFARVLDEHGIAWQYEPHEFVLRRDEDGNVREALTPDFYLPEVGSYVECTVMRQRTTRRKNRKVRLAQELHDVVIAILYKRDLKRLGLWLQAEPEPTEP
jgi:signal transduction histidine kinase